MFQIGQIERFEIVELSLLTPKSTPENIPNGEVQSNNQEMARLGRFWTMKVV